MKQLFLSASIILLYMYQPKTFIPYINYIILTEGVVNRTIHNIYVCMYVYK